MQELNGDARGEWGIGSMARIGLAAWPGPGLAWPGLHWIALEAGLDWLWGLTVWFRLCYWVKATPWL